MTWREHRFEELKKYRAKVAFSTATSEFLQDEILIYQGAAYSRYDGSTAFRFTSEQTGISKVWFLPDAEADISTELFEPCQ